MSPSFLLVVASAVVVACSGAIATLGGDGGGGSDGSSGDSGGGVDGATGDSGSGGDGGGGGDAGGDKCEAMHKQIDALRPAAEKCCPACNHLPCQYVVADLCCPISVDVQTSSDIAAFEQAIQDFKAAGCQGACPGIPCPPAPSRQCDFNTSLCVQ